MQNRKQAFDYISAQLAKYRYDLEQHQAIQDYSLNNHAENFFRDVFNCVYDCHFINANFYSKNTPCIDLLDANKKLAYQITSTISKEKILKTLQALKKPEYQNYDIRLFYLLGKPNLTVASKLEIQEQFAINIDEHLFDCEDLIKAINNLSTEKLLALYRKCFPDPHSAIETQLEVDTFHLPEPTTALIGRQAELKQLTERFTDGKTRLAIIVAAGGIGKSALTDEWLDQIRAQDYYGKTRVFGWSFYSQGSHNTFTNSQPFFSAVLPFLGINDIPKDEIEKARLLARECQKQPCLLILDGLEPLQYAENLPSMNGELQDSALKEFILQFRRAAGQSFVLLSSRQPLVELKKWQDEHFLSLPLATLPHSDGAKLLAKLGVQGNETERQAISQDLNGHALSLVLLGHLLVDHHEGDPRYAKELPPLTSAHGDSDAEKDSRHALRVLDYYDSLQDAASRCFFQLLGLFDRPMNADEKKKLIAKADHAALLRAMTDAEWKKLEQRLENTGLLLGKKGSFGRLEWDTHPIIRSYFGDKFKDNSPEEFKQAHLVLFEYFQKLPEKEFPDTLEEMLPLYRAVEHGCLAGKYQNAFDIFFERIRRNHIDDTKSYSLHELGAYSKDLSASRSFFTAGCEMPVPNLKKDEQAWLLQAVSFCLMSLGRLQEAIEPREQQLKLVTELAENSSEFWVTVIASYQNLIDCYLPLGKLIESKSCSEKMLEVAGKSRKSYQDVPKSNAYQAITLYYGSNFSEAKKYFEKNIQNGMHQNGIYIDSLGGFYNSLFLLDTAKSNDDLKKIQERILICSEIGKNTTYSLINEALNHVILARTYAVLKNEEAEKSFSQAIQFIEKSKKLNYKPLFYFFRADIYLTQNQLEKAAVDLNSAYEIIERCGMKLYQVDYCLIHGRYSLAIQDFDTALNHYEEAKILIQETGYHLRDAELYLLAALICHHTKQTLNTKDANYYLQKAKNRIEEIGQWGLMPRWEKISESGL